jgi:hypothetical protein
MNLGSNSRGIIGSVAPFNFACVLITKLARHSLTFSYVFFLFTRTFSVLSSIKHSVW